MAKPKKERRTDLVAFRARGLVRAGKTEAPALFEAKTTSDYPLVFGHILVSSKDARKVMDFKPTVEVEFFNIRFRCQVIGYQGLWDEDPALVLSSESFFRAFGGAIRKSYG